VAALVLATATVAAPAAVPLDPEFVIHRPSNTGIPGQTDVMWVRFAPDGRVWVSARDHFWLQGGVGILDRATDTWTTYANWQTPLTEWNYDVEWAADGSAWIAGDGALNHFDGAAWVTYDETNSPLAGDRTWDLDTGPDGHLWVVNDDIDQIQGGLFEFDGSAWTHHDEPFMRTSFGASIPMSVFARSTGQVFAAFEFMNGLAYHDGTSWTHVTLAPELLAAAEAPDGTVYGVNGFGTWRLDDGSGAWAQIGTEPSNTIAVDHLGDVWIGTGTTVRRYDGSWSTFAETPSNVYAIEVEPNGDVWISIKHQVRHYAPDGTGIRIYNSINTGMPDYLMDRCYQGRDGNMWFNSGQAGASRFDGTHWRNFGAYNGGEETHPFELPDGGLLAEGVIDVYHDSQDNIWFVSNGAARSPAADLENWELWYWDNSSLPSGGIDHIAEDANGTIWVGHQYGLHRYDGGGWQSHLFGPAGWTENEIEGMTTDLDGTMWVTTAAGKVHEWDGAAWTERIPGTISPHTVAAAPDGSVWIATGNGLWQHDGGVFTQYTTANSGLIRDWVSAVAVRDDGLVAAFCQDIISWPYTGALVFFDGVEWATFAYGESDLPFYQTHDLAFDAAGDLWMINVNNGGVKVTVGKAGTVSAALDCTPASGTLPFTVQFTAELANTTDFRRRVAGRVDAALAGGTVIGNFRTGFTTMSPLEVFTRSWNQPLPALGSLVGDNVFTLTAEDVTPAPFNQPPYPPSGDTGTDMCTVTASSP
jgi:hypothetical protein